jgi:hypothetical protein
MNYTYFALSMPLIRKYGDGLKGIIRMNDYLLPKQSWNKFMLKDWTK